MLLPYHGLVVGSYGHVDDLCRALLVMATHPAAVGEVFNVTTSAVTSAAYVAKLAQVVGVEPDVVLLPDDLTRAADEYEKAVTAAGDNLSPAVNEQLIQTERMLIDSAGLPNRPWFENLIYAPGFYTGYGVKTMPGVRESIEQKQWSAVDPQIERVASALEREASLLETATKSIQH